MSRTVEMEQEINRESDTKLDILSHACLPRSAKKRHTTCVLRPERPECTAYLKLPPSPSWTKVLCYIQEGIYPRGDCVEEFHKHLNDARTSYFGEEQRTLRAVAAILYDQECSGILAPETTKSPLDLQCPVSINFPIIFGIRSHFERMLLIGYGLERPKLASWVYRRFFQHDLSRYLVEFAHCCRRSHFPQGEIWMELGNILSTLYYGEGMEVSDLAIQLYYYHTRRWQTSSTEYEGGVTEYTGIIQELKDEVTVKGPARLIRKLSVDVNVFIPSFVHSYRRRKALIGIAESIAARYNLCIVYSENGALSGQAEKSQANLPSYYPPIPPLGYNL